MAKNIILSGIFIFLISSFLVSALKIDIPIASTTNYSTIDVNNSQYLQGYTPTTLATNFLNTYFYPLNSNPAGYFNVTTLPAGGNASFNQTLTDNSYLKLNQTTPQTISNGRPIFNAGLGTPTGNNFIWGDGTLTTATNNIIIGDGSVTMTSGGSNIIIGNGITKSGYTYGEMIIGHGAPSGGSNSASYGSRTLAGPHQFNNGNVIIGHTSNTIDPELRFFANSNSGSIKWWEDENYFQFGNFFVQDNIKAMFGTARDASIYYDGTNFIINPKVVGTGQLKILGTTNITDNLIVGGNLSVNIPHAMFSSEATQTVGASATAYNMSFNVTESKYQIIKDGDNVTFRVQQEGNYEVMLSIMGSSSVANKHLEIWLEKNGVNVPRSNTRYEFKGVNSEAVLAVPFIVDLNKTDYYRIKYAGDDTGVNLIYTPATAYSPSTPSAIMTIKKISEIK